MITPDTQPNQAPNVLGADDARMVEALGLPTQAEYYDELRSMGYDVENYHYDRYLPEEIERQAKLVVEASNLPSLAQALTASLPTGQIRWNADDPSGPYLIALHRSVTAVSCCPDDTWEDRSVDSMKLEDQHDDFSASVFCDGCETYTTVYAAAKIVFNEKVLQDGSAMLVSDQQVPDGPETYFAAAIPTIQQPVRTYDLPTLDALADRLGL